MNGILMFGVSTAVMTDAVNYVVRQNRALGTGKPE